MKLKFCPDCSLNHPITAFGRNRQAKDGLHYYCKVAARKRSRTWAAANTAKTKAMKVDYRNRVRAKNEGVDPYVE